MKKWALAPALVILSVFILLRFDGGDILQSLRRIPPFLILFLAVLQIASQLLVNAMWHKIARHASVAISFRQMLRVNCLGAAADALTPGAKIGGEAARAVQIRRLSNCSGEEAAAVVVLQKIFSMCPFFLLLLFTLGSLAGDAPFLAGGRFFIYGGPVLLLGLFLCLFFAPRRLREFLQAGGKTRFSPLRRLSFFLQVFLDRARGVRRKPGLCAALFSLSLFIWMLYPAKMYILAAFLAPEGSSLSAAFIASATFASYMTAMLPIFPGGLGGFEGVMSALLAARGFSLSCAAAAAVAFRFVSFWFVLLAGLVFIACENGLPRKLD